MKSFSLMLVCVALGVLLVFGYQYYEEYQLGQEVSDDGGDSSWQPPVETPKVDYFTGHKWEYPFGTMWDAFTLEFQSGGQCDWHKEVGSEKRLQYESNGTEVTLSRTVKTCQPYAWPPDAENFCEAFGKAYPEVGLACTTAIFTECETWTGILHDNGVLSISGNARSEYILEKDITYTYVDTNGSAFKQVQNTVKKGDVFERNIGSYDLQQRY